MRFIYLIAALIGSIALNSFGNTTTDDPAAVLYDDSRVAIVNITIDPASLDWIYTWENRKSDSLHVASIHFQNAFINETVDSVGFRLRGNTSRDSQKKSFKVSFNTFVPGRQFYGVDKLNLNGEHNDPSIIRSKICWDIFQSIGIISSRAAHAAIYINGDYYGLSVMVEHIDDEFLQSRYNDDSGNLWKCLWPADLTYRGDEPQDYYPYHDETRPYELKTNKDEYDYSQLARLIKIINQTPNAQFEDSLEAILVVPEFLKYLAVNILTGSWDDYWALMNNYYIYYEPAKDIFHWIPYDYDNTFGIDWFDIDWTVSNIYNFDKVNDGLRPLAERVMNTPRYRNLYTHFLVFYSSRILGTTAWPARLDSLKEMITPWAEADSFRTLDYGFTTADFHNSFTDGHYSNQHVKRGIKEFNNLRLNSLSGQIEWLNSGPVVYDIDWSPKHPGAQDSIYVSAAAFSHAGLDEVQIIWQPGHLPIVEHFPMEFKPINDTKQVEDADRWIGAIPPLGSGGFGMFQISAKDVNGNTQPYPRMKTIFLRAPDSSVSVVVINEFLAKNDKTIADPAGEYDDWLELYNPGSVDINLAGMYLSDDAENLTRWQFPGDSVILEAGAYLLIWCDNDLDQQGWHTNFKLKSEGEFVALSAGDGVTVIDSITFGVQTADISFGRSPDGAAHWETMQPTPAASNAGTAIKEKEKHKPRSFSLNVYPNPFNQSVVISLLLEQRNAIRASIYDMTGRLIWTKKSTEKIKGKYKLHWNALNNYGLPLSSGLYILRVEAGRDTQIKKLILLK